MWGNNWRWNEMRMMMVMWRMKNEMRMMMVMWRMKIIMIHLPGLTSTCWQIWMSLAIWFSSSLFLFTRLVKLFSRVCCWNGREMALRQIESLFFCLYIYIYIYSVQMFGAFFKEMNTGVIHILNWQSNKKSLSSKSKSYTDFWRIMWHWKCIFAITGMNYILKYIQIENSSFRF